MKNGIHKGLQKFIESKNEFSKALQRSIAPYNAIASAAQKTQKKIYESPISSDTIQIILKETTKPFTSLSQDWVASLAPVMLDFSNSIAYQIVESFNTGSITEEISGSIRSSFNDEFTTAFKSSISTFEQSDFSLNDDYVLFDKSSIKTYEIPDSLVVPFGKNRVKMRTDFFIAIISLFLSIIGTSIAVLQFFQDTNTTNTQIIQLDEPQNALLQTRNQLLYDLLHSIDTSSSSESESLQSLKKEVEEENLHLSKIEKSLDSIEKFLDNNALSDNTESEK